MEKVIEEVPAEIVSEGSENEPEDNVTQTQPAVSPADNPEIKAIMFTYASISAAQQIKGGLSMADCEKLLNARNVLLEFFSKKVEPTNEVFDAYVIMNSICQFHQRQGAFSIEGSVTLKQHLELLEKATMVKSAIDQQPRAPKQQLPPRQQPKGGKSRGGPPVKKGKPGKK